jgi:hypothetical protein
MADLSMDPVRLLGFADLRGIERLRQTVEALPGPPVRVVTGLNVAALVQDEPSTPMARRNKKVLFDELQSIHRRLEHSCQHGAFLPVDPGAACCPSGAVESTLQMSWGGLADCLAQAGLYHQWDVVLRWLPEIALEGHRAALALVAAQRDPAALGVAIGDALRAERTRRETSLVAALSGSVTALSQGGAVGSETEIAITVLVSRGGEGAIEDALDRIPSDQATGVTADLRGPMPPVSFAAVRLVRIDHADIVRSWQILGLPHRADATSLHQKWRTLAAAAHPDRFPGEPASAIQFTEITESYRLLRTLLGAQPGSIDSLKRHTGYRVILPKCSVYSMLTVENAA